MIDPVEFITPQTSQGNGPARASGGDGAGTSSTEFPPLPSPIHQGEGRIIVDHIGKRTVVTTAALPPELMMLSQRAEETAFGLMGLLAAIIIIGPFARMFARRMERRPEVDAINGGTQALQQQLREMQQSMDAMSIEVERISEGQRFQAKLLNDRVSRSPV